MNEFKNFANPDFNIEKNLFDFFEIISKLNPKAILEKTDCCTRLISGINYPLCNGIINPKFLGKNIKEQISEVFKPFKEQNLPMLWWVGPSSEPQNFSDFLEKSGFVKADEAFGMSIDISSLHFQTVCDNIEIKHVSTHYESEVWDSVFSEVFSLPNDALHFFSEPFNKLINEKNKTLNQLIGYLNGKPVSCGSFFISSGIGGIYNIATLDEARGKGVGYALTTAGLNWFKSKNINHAILQSSSKGFNLYRQIGFKKSCSFSLYTNCN